MKKQFYLILLSLSVFSIVFGKNIDEKTARSVAGNFLTLSYGYTLQPEYQTLRLVYIAGTGQYDANASSSTGPLFYIFNISSTTGFVIVSGDDVVVPILGYSFESSFNPEEIPPSTADWLKGYEDQIRYAITQKLEATPEIESCWSALVDGQLSESALKNPGGVNPLVQTKWDQAPFYNDLCPFDNQFSERTVSGCVATAMAMVMKFYNYPPSGIGFHSYNHQKYGTLSSNFGSTQYNWAAMPNSVTSANPAVATLMYHCGVGVDMGYNVGSQGGSGAYVVSGGMPKIACAETALKSYFGYAPTLQGLERTNFTEPQWIALLKADLNAGRPIIYAGAGSGGGHCFVCDGYNDNNYFHFNWGWSGNSDGYYQINALNPGSTGTGGGTGGFNSGQEAITGIHPPLMSGGGSKFFKLALNAPVVSLKDTIYYEDSLFFHTDVLNNGQVTFNGDLSAAIFDSNDVFIEFVDIKKSITLEPGMHLTNGITFINGGLSVMLPGYYYIGIMYSAGDTNWIDVGDTLAYTNYPEIEVINPNDIEMNAAMSVSAGTLLMQGKPVTVQLEIMNYGTEAFNGILDLSLYDVDGEYMNSIEEKTNFTLLPNAATTGLTFSTSSINTEPGDYLMALWYLPDGSQEWQLVGSTDYQNPVPVQVVGEPLQADSYEPNNTPPQASALPLSFTGNTAWIKTIGANCHIGSDYDLYKIDLPKGFSYMINAGLNDLEIDSTQTFTLDGIWSYSTDGTNWSSTYDDAMPNTIIIHDGGTLGLFISPKYTGTTGTYEMNIRISKNPLGLSEPDPQDSWIVYPNPVNDIIYLENKTGYQEITRCILTAADGRELINSIPSVIQERWQIPAANLSDGIHILRICTPAGIFSRKVVIRK